MISEQKQVLPEPDVYGLFLCAVTEMEAGHQLWRKKQYEEFIKVLQTSGICLARALLSARGVSVDGSIENLLSEMNTVGDSNYPVYKSILDVLSFNAGAEVKKEHIREIYKDYQSTLTNARKLLVHDLNYNEKIWQKLTEIFYTRTGLKQLSVVILSLIVLITLPVAIYRYIGPMAVYDLDGQIFWKSKPTVPFSTQNSRHFAVIADNKSREYAVDFTDPEDIFMLRLDPVNKHYLTEIEIQSIRLLGQDDVLLRQLLFDNSMYWSCDNCIGLEKNSNAYRMRPANNDPFLTSSAINEKGVKKITIKMRAVSKKTFWEWALGIEKNLEF
ncbi:MAG: hypothetical protein GXP23_03745 [Gammaproteobacteria bacterium]|nr:hypothetical protein [Gammaproteobacteria bacterium]